jgi:hypothetical protein
VGSRGSLKFAVPGQRIDGVKVVVAALPRLAASFIDAIQQRLICFVHLAVTGHKKTGKSENKQQGKSAQ